ncbi:MAG: amylo-alpha-1,6-glucosidase [Phycisphaerae bacterium]|nr:amylo-alpha-1,6-glucosidase [Phycisphaerae bacterium]
MPITDDVERARQAAIDILLHNSHGPCRGLFRTAGWGYPEPYTRDLMIASLGILVSGNERLVAALRRVLEALAKSQTRRGHITSLAHDPYDRGASDTTPLFLIGVGLFRRATGEKRFLEEAVRKALVWMEYQSPDDVIMVSQEPTSDWRDEHWVLGFGLYVNTLVYMYLRLHGLHEDADELGTMMNRFDVRGGKRQHHVHEGLLIKHKPYYALWAYKSENNERFDLLGNSLAILSGIAAPTRAKEMVSWIEGECDNLRDTGLLALDLPPCLIPYMQPGDPDWRPRYQLFNLPGEYHNGGVWPFICGFYVSALVAAGRPRLAQAKLAALTELIRPARERDVAYGFNEWFRAQDGQPAGRNWQTWSAAMYLYAVECVRHQSTPLLDDIRDRSVQEGSRKSR